MVEHGLRVKVEHYHGGVIRAVAFAPIGGAVSSPRFMPDENIHTRVCVGGRWLWADIDTGEIVGTSDIQRGAVRSRSRFRSRVLAHSWDWFGTLTLDSKKLPSGLGRRSPDVVPYVYEWLHRWRALAPDMRYAIVPELHKNGAFHFHILMAGLPAGVVVPALRGREQIYQRGRAVFDFLPASRALGFTSFTRVRDTLAVSRYMAKYITKSMGTGVSNRGLGFRRWSVSRNVTPAPVSVRDVAVLHVGAWHRCTPTTAHAAVDGVSVADAEQATITPPLRVWVRWGVVSDAWVGALLDESSRPNLTIGNNSDEGREMVCGGSLLGRASVWDMWQYLESIGVSVFDDEEIPE